MNTLRLRQLAVAVSTAAAMMAMPNAQAVVVDVVSFTADPIVIVWGANNAGNTPWAEDLVLLTAGAAINVGSSGGSGTDLIGLGADDQYPVLTGTLNPVPAAGTATPYDNIISPVTGGTGAYIDTGSDGILSVDDTYTAFDLDANTDISFNEVISHSFYVASNCPFDIVATAAQTANTLNASADLTSVKYGMYLTGDGANTDGAITYGSKSRYPNNAAVNGPTDGVTYPVDTAQTGIARLAGTLDNLAAATTVLDGNQSTADPLDGVGTIVEHSVRVTNEYAMDYDLSMETGTYTATVRYYIYNP